MGEWSSFAIPGIPLSTLPTRVDPVRWPVELHTREPLHFGECRMAVEFARCSANEELVNGIFVCANDGEDHDCNGTVDNPEIDVEVLCSAPYLYRMTVWTDYQADPREARFRKQGRYYELGFEWHPVFVRYFIQIGWEIIWGGSYEPEPG